MSVRKCSSLTQLLNLNMLSFSSPTVVKDLSRAATHNTIKMHNFKPCPKQLWSMQTRFETCTLHKEHTDTKNNYFTTATYYSPTCLSVRTHITTAVQPLVSCYKMLFMIQDVWMFYFQWQWSRDHTSYHSYNINVLFSICILPILLFYFLPLSLMLALLQYGSSL